MSNIAEAFADGIREKWIPGINVIENPNFTGVEAWLMGGQFSWLPSPSGSAILELAPPAKGQFANAIASEISRFSCAAYESLLDSAPTDQMTRSLGWPLVRHYYATFYCAHALLRIGGVAITYISAPCATRLNTFGGQYLGFTPGISSGLHAIYYVNGQADQIKVERLSSTNGGSHQEMWTQFLKLLLDVENVLVFSYSGVPAALNAVSLSTKLRANLCFKGRSNGGWASEVRNAINYRQEFGVWFPYQRRSQACIDLTTLMSLWQPAANGLHLGSGQDELVRLAEVCNVSTHLLTATLRDIAKRAPRKGRGFVDRYPFKLLRHHQIGL